MISPNYFASALRGFLVSFILLGLCAIMFLVSVYREAVRQEQFLKNPSNCVAQIVSIKPPEKVNGIHRYGQARYQFQVGGELYGGERPFPPFENRHLGDEMGILYQSDDPSNHRALFMDQFESFERWLEEELRPAQGGLRNMPFLELAFCLLIVVFCLALAISVMFVTVIWVTSIKAGV